MKPDQGDQESLENAEGREEGLRLGEPPETPLTGRRVDRESLID